MFGFLRLSAKINLYVSRYLMLVVSSVPNKTGGAATMELLITFRMQNYEHGA